MTGRRASALLLLLGALVTGLAVGSAAPATAATPAPGVDDAWTAGSRSLLALVPRAIRATCTVREPAAVSDIASDVLDARRGSVACTAAGGDISVNYTKFASGTDADSYVEQLVRPEPAGPNDEPGDCPTQFRIQRDGHGDVGRYACFLDPGDDDVAPGTPFITWTYEPLGVVVQASDAELDLARLRRFWADEAGPLSRANDRGIPPLASRASLRARGKALLAKVPSASRRGCDVIDELTPEALGGAFSSRLWIVADVEECRPDQGSVDTEYMQFATAAATDAYVRDLPDEYATDRRVTTGDAQCAGSGPYRDDGRRIGKYVCWFSMEDTDAHETSREFAHLLFTDLEHRVVVSGGAPARDVKALLEWWRNDARLH
jgi:hypothetical protein